MLGLPFVVSILKVGSYHNTMKMVSGGTGCQVLGLFLNIILLESEEKSSLFHKYHICNLNNSDMANVVESISYIQLNDGQDPHPIDAVTIDGKPASAFQTSDKLVTELSASSTDEQYPSAKCMYDIIGDLETRLSNI